MGVGTTTNVYLSQLDVVGRRKVAKLSELREKLKCHPELRRTFISAFKKSPRTLGALLKERYPKLWNTLEENNFGRKGIISVLTLYLLLYSNTSSCAECGKETPFTRVCYFAKTCGRACELELRSRVTQSYWDAADPAFRKARGKKTQDGVRARSAEAKLRTRRLQSTVRFDIERRMPNEVKERKAWLLSHAAHRTWDNYTSEALALRNARISESHSNRTHEQRQRTARKRITTLTKRYGVANIMHSKTFAIKAQVNAFRIDYYEFGGRVHECQGYEIYVLDKIKHLIDKLRTQVPIKYMKEDGRSGVYYADALVRTKSGKLAVIEVKSSWTEKLRQQTPNEKLKIRSAIEFCKRNAAAFYVAVASPSKDTIQWKRLA